MLGKTHIVSSLAIAHVALVSYTSYLSQERVTDVGDTGGGFIESMLGTVPLNVFGMTIGAPVSLLTYMMMVATVSLFILLVLRAGSRSVLMGYAAAIVVLLIGLNLLADSGYAIDMTVALLLFGLGSLLPDIDSENSTLGRYVKPLSRAIPHRTITHTIWIVGILLGFSFYLKSYYLLALTLGYTLHIVQDTLSRQGICWFYPMVGKYTTFSSGATMKVGRKTKFSYRVGGTGETIMFYSSIGAHIICVGLTLWFIMA